MNTILRQRLPSICAQMLVLFCAAVTLRATPQPSSAGRASPAAEFLTRLKQAVDASDPRSVATMVAYPLTVLASGFNIPVKDVPSFVRMYDSVFTPELRCAIVGAELPTAGTAGSHASVTITPDGLLIAAGAIWAPFKDGRYRIRRIRMLPAAPSVEGRKGTEHVAFDTPSGERTATFAGWLVRHNVDVYVVSLKKGETLQARIDGFRGHDATLRVSPREGGGEARPSPANPPDIGRLATAKTSADAEYRVEVAALAPYCDPPQRYKLTLSIR